MVVPGDGAIAYERSTPVAPHSASPASHSTVTMNSNKETLTDLGETLNASCHGFRVRTRDLAQYCQLFGKVADGTFGGACEHQHLPSTRLSLHSRPYILNPRGPHPARRIPSHSTLIPTHPGKAPGRGVQGPLLEPFARFLTTFAEKCVSHKIIFKSL